MAALVQPESSCVFDRKRRKLGSGEAQRRVPRLGSVLLRAAHGMPKRRSSRLEGQ